MLIPSLQLGMSVAPEGQSKVGVDAGEHAVGEHTEGEILARRVAASSAGYSPADLANVCREAVLRARSHADQVNAHVPPKVNVRQACHDMAVADTQLLVSD